MKSHKPFNVFLIVAFFIVTIVYTSYSQEYFKTLGRYKYAKFDGVWYTIVDGNQGDLVDTSHIIVRLKGKADISIFNFAQAGLPNLKNVRGRFADGFYELEVPVNFDPFETASKLIKTNKFEEVHFNVFLRVDDLPNDPLYNNQWNLSKILMSQAWDISTGLSSIIVAVIDVGADHGHEDLVGNRWSGIGYNFYNNNSNPYPPDGARHGTAVAGILGAVTNNGLGVSGLAGGWSGSGGIRIMHLRAGYRDSNGEEWIDLSAAVEATDYAATNGARVINMSFGGGSYSELEAAINNAVNNYGVVVVASAGNYRLGQSTSIRYPARYSNVIAVGATTPNDTRKELNDGTENWWGSCYGQELDVVAPGVYIRTTDLTGTIGYSTGNYYNSFNGTSSAAPQVAGLAALILSVNPSLTWQQVRDILRNTADDKGPSGFDIEYGYGRINSLRALGNAYLTNHSDYEFVYNNVSLSQYNNANMVFLAGPNWCNSAGTYYNTERHRLLIEVNRSFTNTPLAWYIGPVGYSWSNPNNATSWLSQTVNESTIRYETVFYRLNQGDLSCEDRWAPFDPNAREKIYSYLGRPLVAPVISNFTQSPNPICKGTTGYVYVNLSQGNGNLTYNWFSYNAPSGVTVNFSPNSNRCTITYSSADAVALGAEGPTWDFGCTVSNSVGESTMRYTPILSDCNGCPTLSFEQNGMLFDENPLLNTSLRNPGKDVIDYYLINTPITPVNNKIKLTVHEPQTEHSWFDQISLIEATANQGENIVVNEQGQVINYSSTIPLRIMLNGQTDITSALGNMDSVTVQLNVGDVITITRFTEGVEADGDVVLGGVEPPPSQKRLSSLRMNLRKQTITEKGEEVTEIIPITEFFLRPNKSIISKRITNLPSGVIELQVNKPLELDYFAFVINLRTVKTKTLTLNSALHSLNGEIKGKLNNVDGNYGELRPTERIDLTFNTTTTTGNKAYILKTVGRYETDSLYLKGINKPMFTESSEEIPTEYKLFDNYPNPFNPTTVISWQSPVGSWQTLKVYDVLGNQVVTLVNEYREAGSYKVEFNASALASGVYIYKLTAGSYISSKKMMVIK